nr:MAG TPA: hypothetical protein [Caudoviricetes sp.]
MFNTIVVTFAIISNSSTSIPSFPLVCIYYNIF